MTGPMTCAEALDLAKRWAATKGIHAFPVAIAWDNKKQATNKWPLTEHGHLDATTDPAVLERLFNAKSPGPGAVWGVGLWPGPSDHLVLDPDIKGGKRGDDELAALEAEHGRLDTLRAVTASGGGHVYLRKPAGVHIGNADLADGVEVRGDDGWVVAIGTRTPWGSWDHDEATPRAAIDCPRWLLDRLASTNGSGGGKGKWSKVDRSKLHPADLATLEALEALGGHDAYLGGDGALMIVRPGKIAGGSASIGHIAPGVVKMFTDDWEIPGTNVKFVTDARYDADTLVAIVENLDDPHLVARLVDPPAFKNANASSTPRRLELVPASTIPVDRPYWVWEQRIPVGGTTLMPGREGLGKTVLICWLMARLTRGELPGQWFGRPARVVYIGIEDDRGSVLNPRLIAAGADLDRVHFVDMPDGTTFSVGVDTATLAAEAAGRDVALVVVDPLDGHLQGVDTHRKSEVQHAVAKLARLAQDLRCGALGLAHLNKGDVRDLLQRVVGSVGFTTSVRALLGVGEHPDNPAERVCVLGKANMTDRLTVPALRFKIEKALVSHPDGGDDVDTGLAVILGEEFGIDADAVIDSGSPAERTQREEDADWLAEVLSEGPMPLAEVRKLARAEGIDKTRLRRAREAVGIVVTRNQNERGRPSLWALKDYGSPPRDPKPHDPKSAPPLTSANGSDDPITGHLSESDPKPLIGATESDDYGRRMNPGELGPIDRSDGTWF